MEIAVLDLGSTTFHLQHTCVAEDAAFTTVLDEKESICLGSQVFADGRIDDRSRELSLQSVGRLLEQSLRREASHRVIVATSAIRSASNGAELVREIERRFRIAVKVLDPEEEARLAYLGQSTSPVVGGRRVAAIDLGGGSVELAVGSGARCVHACSLPLGALRMRALGSSYGAQEARALATLLRTHMAEPLAQVSALDPEIIVFGSGSARAARKLLLAQTALPGKTGPLEVATFRSALDGLLGRTPDELIALGVEPARASSVLVSATIMVQMLELLHVHSAMVTDKGLRDGVALEVYRERAAKPRGLADAIAPV